MAFAIIGIAIVTILLFWYLNKKKTPNHGLKEIPGPPGLPFLGNVHQMGKNPTEQFVEWTKEYGDIYKVKLASNEIIVVSNPKLTKEMFSNDAAFTGKPHFEGFDMYLDEPHLGVLGSEGDMWEIHRRFLLRQLRDFGFGKSAMETLIADEVHEVIERFKKEAGKPITNIKESFLRLAVVNSLWTILTGERMGQDDPKLTRLAFSITESFNDLLEKAGFLVFMPWLRHVIPERSGYNQIRRVNDECKATFMKTLIEHKAIFDEDNIRDFIDAYLAEMKKTNDPQNVFYGEKAEKHLIVTMFDLFIAGSETTATTLEWAVLFLSKNEDVQKKLQQEILEITGNSRKVSVTDRPDMPYTLAVIDEILRHSSIVPDGVQHRAMTDGELHGYHVPKDAWLQANLYYIHHDPKLWGDPFTFRPQRFLSEDGKKYQKSENLQPFQIGRRQCVGETLARDSIFLFLTNIFQQFSTKLDPSQPEPNTLKSKIGFIRSPEKYFVIMEDRLTK